MDTKNSLEDISVIETNSAEKNEIIEDPSAVENIEKSSSSQVTKETDLSNDTVVASIVASIDDAMKEDSPITNPSDDAIKSQQVEILAQKVAEVDVEPTSADGNCETIISNENDASGIEYAKEENQNIVETATLEANSPPQEVAVETITEPHIEEANIASNTGTPESKPEDGDEVTLKPSVIIDYTDVVPESVESLIAVPDDDDSSIVNTAIQLNEDTAVGSESVNISEDNGTEEIPVSDIIEMNSEKGTKEPSNSDPILDNNDTQPSESVVVENAASASENTILDTLSHIKTDVVFEELIEDKKDNINPEEVQDITEEKPATALEDKEDSKDDLVDEEKDNEKTTDTVLKAEDNASLVEEVAIISLETNEELNTTPLPDEETGISCQSNVETDTKNSADPSVPLESPNIPELATQNNQEDVEPETTIDSETVVLSFEDTPKLEELVEPGGAVSEHKEHSEITVEIEKYEEDVKVVASEWDIAGEVVESSLVEDEEQAIGSDQARSAAFLTEVLSVSDEDTTNSAIDTTEIANDTCARDDISFEETLPTQQGTIQLSSEDSILDEPLTTDNSEHFTTNTSSISEYSDIHGSESSITASVPGGNIAPEESVSFSVREEPFMQQREKSITSSPRLAEDKSRATKKDEKKNDDSNLTVKVAALLIIVIAWILYHILKS